MSKYHGRLAVPVKGWRKPLAKIRGKDYFCTVVAEDVEIALENKPSRIRKSRNELFVQCNQLECQYVDLAFRRQLPHINLFADLPATEAG
jgi:hypothetical protein